MLPYCKVAHVTKVNHAYEADTYFPNLDEKDEWVVTGVSEEQTYFDLEYEFVRYERLQ
jgi:dihydrofolate reductase